MNGYYTHSIEDKKDYKAEILKDAYKSLWDTKASLTYKMDALSVIALFAEEKEVRERLEYFIEKESNPRLERMMQDILDGNYENDLLDDEDIDIFSLAEDEEYNSSIALLRSPKPSPNTDHMAQILETYKSKYLSN